MSLRIEKPETKPYEPRLFFKGRGQMTVMSRREEQSARANGWQEQPPPPREKAAPAR